MYLGSIITAKGNSISDIKSRIKQPNNSTLRSGLWRVDNTQHNKEYTVIMV